MGIDYAKKILSAAVTFFILLAVCSAALAQDITPAAQPAAAPAQGPVPRFDIKDIYGRIISGQSLEGWLLVYGFGNEDNAETAVGWLKDITLNYPDAEGVLYVIVADTSKYTRVLQPMVKKILKKEYKKNVEDVKAKLVAAGHPISYTLEDRYVLISDSKAELFDHFAIPGDQRKAPHIYIVDGKHNVRGHFTDYTPEVTALFGKLLDEQKAEKSKSLQVTKRKKNMLPRYAIGGVLLWLLLK